MACALLLSVAPTAAVHADAQMDAPRPPSAMSDPAEIDRWVEATLTAGIEPSGASTAIVALGEPGERALVRVFERASTPQYVRLRALSALGGFRTESAARYFEQLLRSARTPANGPDRALSLRSPLVLRRALEGLGASGKPFAERLDRSVVSAYLDHPDAHVRRVAAEVLAALGGGAEVDRALEKRLSRERSPMVRAHLEQALTDRSARPRAPRSAGPGTGSRPR